MNQTLIFQIDVYEHALDGINQSIEPFSYQKSIDISSFDPPIFQDFPWSNGSRWRDTYLGAQASFELDEQFEKDVVSYSTLIPDHIRVDYGAYQEYNTINSGYPVTKYLDISMSGFYHPITGPTYIYKTLGFRISHSEDYDGYFGPFSEDDFYKDLASAKTFAFTMGALKQDMVSGAEESVLYSGIARLLSVDGQAVSAIPEPSAWIMMLISLGFTGAALRLRRLNGKLANAID